MFTCSVYDWVNERWKLWLRKKDIFFGLGIILELVNVKLQSMLMPSHTA
jgi:hypothetical protein